MVWVFWGGSCWFLVLGDAACKTVAKRILKKSLEVRKLSAEEEEEAAEAAACRDSNTGG